VRVNNTLDKNNLIGRLDRHLDWIKSCDTKASIVIAGIGLFLTIFTSEHSLIGIGAILKVVVEKLDFANFLFLLLFLSAILLILYGCYNLIRVLVPRLKKEVSQIVTTGGNSLYFFETIADRDFSSFKHNIRQEDEETEIEDIISQIYINAKICTIKYRYYGKGIRFSFIGISMLIIMYITGLILLKVGGF